MLCYVCVLTLDFYMIKDNFAHITRNVVQQFVNTCSGCDLDKVNPYVSPIQPITSHDFWERVQLHFS